MTIFQTAPIPATEAGLLRALLRAGRADAMPQDLIDCAELALSAGARDIGAMLYGLTALRIGVSAPSLTMLHEVNARACLWDRLPKADDLSVGGFSVDLALGELRRLMRFGPKLKPCPSTPEACLPPDSPMGTQPRRGLDPALAALAQRVGDALRCIPLKAKDGGLVHLLRDFADEVLKLRPIHVEEYADAGVDQLALVFVLEGMRRFLLANADLLSAEPDVLFDEAAALPPGGLGPFFSNVHMLLRGTSDLLALIDVAAGGRADPETMECWSVLLAAHLPSDRLTSLTAELGDRGMDAGLRRILVKIARAGGEQRQFDVANSIRDASLDIDAFALAADAQQLIALWLRADADQWRRLGEIRGYAGDLPAAEVALERALRMNPRDRDARALLAHVRSGEPVPFKEIHVARRNLRRARLAAFQAASQAA